MIETIILLASPTIVSWIVELQKKLSSIKYSENKKTILRGTAVALSFGGAFLSGVVSGEPLSDAYVQELVAGALIFGASQIPYLLGAMKAKRGGV